MKVKFFWRYPLDLEMDCDKPTEVYIDRFNFGPMPKGTIRVVVLQEPYKRQLYSYVREYPNKYTHVLTYHSEILASNPKARLFIGLNTWMTGYVMKDKDFCVSTVVGGKSDADLEGYSLRHRTWWAKEFITNPIDFYLSGGDRWSAGDYETSKMLGATKEPLFDSQFHIAIENTSILNMFSEKLTDCFQTRTVPIYYGAPNIGEFFNIEGIIVARNVSEIVNACNALTPETYDKMLPAIEDNYERSMNWRYYSHQIRDTLNKILAE
jgi:hypothetical protein